MLKDSRISKELSNIITPGIVITVGGTNGGSGSWKDKLMSVFFMKEMKFFNLNQGSVMTAVIEDILEN